jgi:hypothetical protein
MESLFTVATYSTEDGRSVRVTVVRPVNRLGWQILSITIGGCDDEANDYIVDRQHPFGIRYDSDHEALSAGRKRGEDEACRRSRPRFQ